MSWLAKGRKDYVAEHEAAGVTWLVEGLVPWVLPFDQALARVQQGPTAPPVEIGRD